MSVLETVVGVLSFHKDSVLSMKARKATTNATKAAAVLAALEEQRRAQHVESTTNPVVRASGGRASAAAAGLPAPPTLPGFVYDPVRQRMFPSSHVPSGRAADGTHNKSGRECCIARRVGRGMVWMLHRRAVGADVLVRRRLTAALPSTATYEPRGALPMESSPGQFLSSSVNCTNDLVSVASGSRSVSFLGLGDRAHRLVVSTGDVCASVAFHPSIADRVATVTCGAPDNNGGCVTMGAVCASHDGRRLRYTPIGSAVVHKSGLWSACWLDDDTFAVGGAGTISSKTSVSAVLDGVTLTRVRSWQLPSDALVVASSRPSGTSDSGRGAGVYFGCRNGSVLFADPRASATRPVEFWRLPSSAVFVHAVGGSHMVACADAVSTLALFDARFPGLPLCAALPGYRNSPTLRLGLAAFDNRALVCCPTLPAQSRAVAGLGGTVGGSRSLPAGAGTGACSSGPWDLTSRGIVAWDTQECVVAGFIPTKDQAWGCCSRAGFASSAPVSDPLFVVTTAGIGAVTPGAGLKGVCDA